MTFSSQFSPSPQFLSSFCFFMVLPENYYYSSLNSEVHIRPFCMILLYSSNPASMLDGLCPSQLANFLASVHLIQLLK